MGGNPKNVRVKKAKRPLLASHGGSGDVMLAQAGPQSPSVLLLLLLLLLLLILLLLLLGWNESDGIERRINCLVYLGGTLGIT
jgi:hypothetical protein